MFEGYVSHQLMKLCDSILQEVAIAGSFLYRYESFASCFLLKYLYDINKSKTIALTKTYYRMGDPAASSANTI
jgi:hypothetical protein